VLDGTTKDGVEVEVSSDDNEEDDGEGGEDDMDGELDAEFMNKLDPEMREKFEKGELNSQDLKALGFGEFGAEGGENELNEGEYGEEGEADDDEGDDDEE
jgi:hypothetical protein